MNRRSWLQHGRLIAAVVAMLCLCATVRAQAVQWADNGHWYEVVYVPEGISWTEAKDAAKARGGYLVSITSTLENDFVYNLINKDERYWVKGRDSDNRSGPWIGAYQTDKLAEPDGHWAWVSGEPWEYKNWASGEPNNWDGVEDYGCFFAPGATMGKQWNDCAETPPDGEKIKAYIVEYDARPAATQSATTAATAAAIEPDDFHVVDVSGPWNWAMLGSWVLIGILLAALVGMAYLWNRARQKHRAP